MIQLIDGMDENGLLDGLHSILTGYIGSSTFLHSISEVVDRVKEKNPDLVYICDPVLGDNGKLYVPAELVGLFRDVIVPKASIVTPN